MTTTHDFQDGKGPVPAHQHPNGGGWVANTAQVADTAYVGVNARVYGEAQVSGRAQVYGEARIAELEKEIALLRRVAEAADKLQASTDAHIPIGAIPRVDKALTDVGNALAAWREGKA